MGNVRVFEENWALGRVPWNRFDWTAVSIGGGNVENSLFASYTTSIILLICQLLSRSSLLSNKGDIQ